MNIKHFAAAIVSGALLAAGAASAATYDYSYTFASGDVLSGQLDGTLQGDGNSVIVSDVVSTSFNGRYRPAFGYIDGISSSSPTLSLDGSVMDFLACWTPLCITGVAFDSAGAMTGGTPLAVTGWFLGNNFDIYDSANWSLTPTMPAVPLPASGLLLLTTAAGFFAFRRKRAV